MLRDLFRAALAALVLWPAVDRRPAPPCPLPPPPPAAVPVPWPVAVQAPPAYNPPPPSRLRAAVAAALDSIDRMAPF